MYLWRLTQISYTSFLSIHNQTTESLPTHWTGFVFFVHEQLATIFADAHVAARKDQGVSLIGHAYNALLHLGLVNLIQIDAVYLLNFKAEPTPLIFLFIKPNLAGLFSEVVIHKSRLFQLVWFFDDDQKVDFVLSLWSRFVLILKYLFRPDSFISKPIGPHILGNLQSNISNFIGNLIATMDCPHFEFGFGLNLEAEYAIFLFDSICVQHEIQDKFARQPILFIKHAFQRIVQLTMMWQKLAIDVFDMRSCIFIRNGVTQLGIDDCLFANTIAHNYYILIFLFMSQKSKSQHSNRVYLVQLNTSSLSKGNHIKQRFKANYMQHYKKRLGMVTKSKTRPPTQDILASLTTKELDDLIIVQKTRVKRHHSELVQINDQEFHHTKIYEPAFLSKLNKLVKEFKRVDSDSSNVKSFNTVKSLFREKSNNYENKLERSISSIPYNIEEFEENFKKDKVRQVFKEKQKWFDGMSKRLLRKKVKLESPLFRGMDMEKNMAATSGSRFRLRMPIL